MCMCVCVCVCIGHVSRKNTFHGAKHCKNSKYSFIHYVCDWKWFCNCNNCTNTVYLNHRIVDFFRFLCLIYLFEKKKNYAWPIQNFNSFVSKKAGKIIFRSPHTTRQSTEFNSILFNSNRYCVFCVIFIKISEFEI